MHLNGPVQKLLAKPETFSHSEHQTCGMKLTCIFLLNTSLLFSLYIKIHFQNIQATMFHYFRLNSFFLLFINATFRPSKLCFFL